MLRAGLKIVVIATVVAAAGLQLSLMAWIALALIGF